MGRTFQPTAAKHGVLLPTQRSPRDPKLDPKCYAEANDRGRCSPAPVHLRLVPHWILQLTVSPLAASLPSVPDAPGPRHCERQLTSPARRCLAIELRRPPEVPRVHTNLPFPRGSSHSIHLRLQSRPSRLAGRQLCLNTVHGCYQLSNLCFHHSSDQARHGCSKESQQQSSATNDEEFGLDLCKMLLITVADLGHKRLWMIVEFIESSFSIRPRNATSRGSRPCWISFLINLYGTHVHSYS